MWYIVLLLDAFPYSRPHIPFENSGKTDTNGHIFNEILALVYGRGIISIISQFKSIEKGIFSKIFKLSSMEEGMFSMIYHVRSIGKCIF